MKKMPFPLNYFNSIATPKRVFKGRENLSWIQNIVIFIFLNALLMFPVSLYFSQSTNFQLQEIMPHTLRLVTDEFATKLQAVEFENGKLISGEPFTIVEDTGVVGVEIPKSVKKSKKNLISFEKDYLLLKDESGYQFEVRYTENFSLKNSQTKSALKEQIKEQWFKQNKAFVSFTMMLMTGIIISFSNVLVMFIAAFFIWMTKRSALSSIRTYKESFNLILNASGIGTLLAVLIGLVHFDMTIMIGFQSLGLVIMLTAVFAVTHFSDTPIKNKRKRNEEIK